MNYVSAIVLAAGKGFRFRSKVSKPLAEISSQPAIIYCLDTLSKHREIKEIILVVNANNSQSIAKKVKQYHIKKIRGVIRGGQLRQESVINGLKAISPKADLVLIHDGVRPFIDKKAVSSVIKEAKSSGAAIVGVPVKATIKVVAGRIVKKTLDRSNLWEVQTPQVFKKDLILKAYKRFGSIRATDDAMLVEKLGARVSIVLGSYANIKITTPEDLVIAEALLKVCYSR